MNLKTKLFISKITTGIIIATVLLIVIWFIGFIVSITFDLSVFDRRTSTFLGAILGGAFVLVTCSAILNVVINISIIAEKNIRVDDIKEVKINYRKVFVIVFSIIFVITAFLFIGDYASTQFKKRNLISEASDIIERYPSSIDVLKKGLTDKSRINKIPKTLEFLSNLKQDFPSVSLISTEKFNNDTAYVLISSQTVYSDLEKPLFDYSFYQCNKKDCEYLEKVFAQGFGEKYFYELGDDFNLYIPFIKEKKPFILLFSKYTRYGKVGSGSM